MTTLFCKGWGQPITPREAHNYFQRVLRGWRVLRHSFVAALASRGGD